MQEREYEKVLREVLADFEFDAELDTAEHTSPVAVQAPEAVRDAGLQINYDSDGNIIGRNERETVMTKMRTFEVGLDVLNQRMKMVEREVLTLKRLVGQMDNKEQSKSGVFG